MKRAVPVLILAVTALVAAPLARDGKARSETLKTWIEGPARYIVTPEELKEFKGLETDDERATWIERFWVRRDPTPTTWFNEYRQLFWQRVQESNERFTDSPRPGWRTDRGKIFILYGPPDETYEDLNADVASREVGSSRGLLRWTYTSRPGGRKDMDPVVVVPFVRDATGEYRLSYDPILSSIFFNVYTLRDADSPIPWEQWLAATALRDRSRLSVMLDLGKLQEVPPQEQVLLERVETVETFSSKPLDVSLHRFEPPGTETALVIATLEIPRAEGDDEPGIVVRFAPRDVGRRSRILAEGSFRIETVLGRRLAQGRVDLDSGTWDVTALAVDPAANVNLLWRGSITVPTRVEPLHASDPVLAFSLEPLEFASLVSYEAPFTIGAFRVAPRASPKVRRGEPIVAFLEVYGGEPPYRVTFRLEGLEDDGRWSSLGSAQTMETPSASAGWSMPTGPAWPLGPYRVVATAEDSVGARVETVLELEVEAAITEASEAR